MKKVLLGLVAVALLLIGGGYTWYHSQYGGQDYYIQIHKDGEKLTQKTQDGGTWHGFGYDEKAYSKTGQEKELKFTTVRNLRQEAYLKLIWNRKNGVISWEEVQKKDVPEKALNNI
ncbi:YxeA family protein [Lactococcus garvieae]|uniref:YxeA family protein n=1 Tax=Lactococcus garvieae TaxID=1363 RepID=UPI0018D60C9B|nr:YxeA family protein [Lactococcus garvieae]QPS71399.1 YxeA family protein [Lactococcus garvieae]